MLVLSRKIGEKVVIDGNIVVEVIKIHGNRITLGIEAPSEVRIRRGELNPTNRNASTVDLVVEDGVLVAC